MSSDMIGGRKIMLTKAANFTPTLTGCGTNFNCFLTVAMCIM